MADTDSVLINRRKIFVGSNESNSPQNDENNSDSRYAKAFAIVLFTFAALLLLSLISYTSSDESNALTPISKLFGLFTGDEAIKFKAETSKNWLGLIGSILSYHFYNSTFGIAILGLPIFLGLFAFELWKSSEISMRSLKNFGIYLLISILFASMMATISQSELFGLLPKELSGNIGLFLSSFLINAIGYFGSFLVFLALLLTTVIIGTNLKVDYFINKIIDSSAYAGKFARDKIKESFNNDQEKKLKDKKNTVQRVPSDDTKSNIEIVKEDTKTLERKVEPKKENHKNKRKTIINKVRFRPLTINKNAKDEESTSFDDNYSDETTAHQKPEDNLSNKQIFDISIDEQSDNGVIKDEKEVNFSSEENISHSNFNNNSTNDFSQEDEDPYLGNYKSENFTEEDDESENITGKHHKPGLTLNVEEIIEEEPSSDSPISTRIHDEEIRYTPPSYNLLKPAIKSQGVDDDELEINARILQEKLETFKIYIENLEITPGPVVTQYAFEPAAGIKISKIESLADDLAMALKAKGIRIIAPIPGKGLVGIEIPNNNPSLVTFSSIINSIKFKEKKYHLPVALGKTISGETALTDLAKTPHLLMAGATGSGKSVGVNTIICSLLYKMPPSELKFVIIDPKKVELQQYKALKNHFLAMSPDVRSPIITDPVEAVAVLKSTVMEMEKRYDILAAAGQRNIADYNQKVAEGKYKDDKTMVHRKMPYIVVIVDEYADIMLTSGKEIEQPIVMLAQKARAIGIHLVLATQRPSVDVITGIIKANFPARIAYLVASKVDSRTILDTSGADQLLGMGDMLFLPPGKPTPERIQNAFISTDEVDAICEHIGNQKGYSEPYWLPSIHDGEEGGGQIAPSDRDPLFREAAVLVVQTLQGSVSLIQRRLKVGYARAGRIMDELYDAGIVGPFEGSKARQVLIDNEDDLNDII